MHLIITTALATPFGGMGISIGELRAVNDRDILIRRPCSHSEVIVMKIKMVLLSSYVA